MAGGQCFANICKPGAALTGPLGPTRHIKRLNIGRGAYGAFNMIITITRRRPTANRQAVKIRSVVGARKANSRAGLALLGVFMAGGRSFDFIKGY
jgi:hypothetical protein